MISSGPSDFIISFLNPDQVPTQHSLTDLHVFPRLTSRKHLLKHNAQRSLQICYKLIPEQKLHLPGTMERDLGKAGEIIEVRHHPDPMSALLLASGRRHCDTKEERTHGPQVGRCKINGTPSFSHSLPINYRLIIIEYVCTVTAY